MGRSKKTNKSVIKSNGIEIPSSGANKSLGAALGFCSKVRTGDKEAFRFNLWQCLHGS